MSKKSKTAAAAADAWPISHPVIVAALPARPGKVRIVADEAQRKATADMLDVIAVDALVGDLTIEPRGARVVVAGTVRAKVRQACVVTLEPVEETVEEPVDFVFAPEEEAAEAEKRVHAAAEKAEREGDFEKIAELFAADSLPDPIRNGQVDLGQVVVETLAIGLNPYPRKEGAEFVQPDGTAGDISPFAALGKLKG